MEKPFIGEVIELEPEINDHIDPHHLKVFFNIKQVKCRNRQVQNDEIQIIEYDKEE